MKTLKNCFIAAAIILLGGCANDKKSNGSEDPKAEAMTKCESFTKSLHQGKQGFRITGKRIDPREEVKLALDEKYESRTKYISSISFEVDGENMFCTCYIDENFDIINKEDLKTE